MASTITNTREELLAQAARGAITAFPPITHIAFGSGGADSQGRPLEPNPAQTALNSELMRYAIDWAISPEFNISRYSVTIPEDALPGKSISEAGLYDSEGNLVSIKNMPPKVKEAGIKLVYTFDDLFTGGI